MKKIVFLITVFTSIIAYGQRDWSSITITSEKLSDNIYVLFGSGGNIGLAIGEENAYLIDDQLVHYQKKYYLKKRMVR